MNRTEQRMASTMHDMLYSKGYYVDFRFTKTAVIATIPTGLLFKGATTEITFTELMSPGEVVAEIQRVLDRLNSPGTEDS